MSETLSEVIKERVTVTQTNTIEVCTISEIKKGDVTLASNTHMLALSEDSDLSGCSDLVKKIASVIWS